MIETVEAIFRDGVFCPDRQLNLAESTRVRLVVETVTDQSDQTGESLRQQAWKNLELLWQTSTFDSHGDRLSRDELHERR